MEETSMAKTKPLGPVTRTNRGFELIEFLDCYDDKGSLQASSLAVYVKPGTSAIWLGREGHRLHLHRDQVEALIKHLRSWLKNDTFNYET